VLGLASDTVERAYASPAAPTETVAGVSLPSNEAALQRLGEAIADDGTQALPGQVEPVLGGSPQPVEQTRGKPGCLQRVRLGAEREARSGIVTAAVVRVGEVLIGGALLLAGAGTDPHPVDASQMRELADRYNQKLKQQLGVQVLPLVSPDKAGLAVGLRF